MPILQVPGTGGPGLAADAVQRLSILMLYKALLLHLLVCSALLQHGEQRLEEMRRHFMEAYPDPEAPLSHTPAARLICLRRLVASSL